MKIAQIVLQPKVKIYFTKEELGLLTKLSQTHYDGNCKRLSEIGGSIYGLNNFMPIRGRGVESGMMAFSEVDLCCKVCERHALIPEVDVELQSLLFDELKQVLNSLASAALKGNEAIAS